MAERAPRTMPRFLALLAAVVVIPWLATLAAALIASGGLADRGSAARAEIVGRAIADDVDHALSLGLPLDRLAGMDDYLADAVAGVPAIKLVMVTDAEGRTLFQKADRDRPDLSMRQSPAEMDWSALGLVQQRFPIRMGTGMLGAVVLGREAQALPADPRRILIDFAVALSIALATGALLLRMLLQSMVVGPLGLVAELEAGMARRVYDRIAPTVEQSLIQELLSAINAVVVGANERFARVRAYLAEVRDLSFAKDAPERVAPLIREVEGLGRFAPDHLVALVPEERGNLPHAAVFGAGAAVAVVVGLAGQRLPLDVAAAAVGLGVAVAAPVAAVMGRLALPLAALALLLWGLLLGGTAPGDALSLSFAAAALGGLGSALPWQAARITVAVRGGGLVVFATRGLVVGAALAVLCAGTIGVSVLLGAVILVGAVVALVAWRVGSGGSVRVTPRQLARVDRWWTGRWWTGGPPRPAGWALWTMTGLAVVYLAVPGTAPDPRSGPEFVWLHTVPAWVAMAGAATVMLRLPRFGLLYELGTAAAALVLAADPLGRSVDSAYAVAIALGVAHAAHARGNDGAPAEALRGWLCLAAGLVLAWLARGAASGPALLAGGGLLIAVLLVPPLLAGLWRAAVPTARGAGSAKREAA